MLHAFFASNSSRPADTSADGRAHRVSERLARISYGRRNHTHAELPRRRSQRRDSLSASSRGQQRGPRSTDETKLVLALPELKGDVRLNAELRIEARSKGQIVASLVEPIGLYSPNPLDLCSVWAKSLQIQLLDPEDDTAAAFASIDLPHARHNNSRVLLDKPGLIVLGEGLDIDVFRSLSKDSSRPVKLADRCYALLPALATGRCPVSPTRQHSRWPSTFADQSSSPCYTKTSPPTPFTQPGSFGIAAPANCGVCTPIPVGLG